MLTKLIKYDIRATWRGFAAIYLAILLGVTLIPIILNTVDSPLINLAIGFIITATMIAVVVVTIVNLFRIFHTSIFSKEGYLTMTLPVTPGKLVSSKLMVSTLWIVLTGLVSVIGILLFGLILSGTSLVVNPVSLGDFVHALFSKLNGQNVLFIFLLILCIVISFTKEIAKLFLSCSIAHLKQLSHFRIPAGIIAYFVFSWLETLLVRLVVFLGELLLKPIQETMHFTVFDFDISMTTAQSFTVLNSSLAVIILYTLAITVLFSCGIVWLLKHKLDLD